MPYEELSDIPFDPRMLKRLGPKQMAEQPADFLGAWGGAAGYAKMARMPQAERLTYAAVLDGVTTPDQIAIVTGLSSYEVTDALKTLQKEGVVVDVQQIVD